MNNSNRDNNKNGSENRPANRPPRADLKTAFWWYCDACGTENFERATLPEISNQDMEAVMAAHNIDPSAASFFCVVPDWVVCKVCGVSHEAHQSY